MDQTAVDLLVADVARTFVEGLERLVATAVAEVDVENARILQDASELDERRARLDSEEVQLHSERARFERELALFGEGGLEQSEAVSLNLGGEANVTVLRSTLTQCEDSMLAAAFSGRWELPKDASGSTLIDFEASLFMPLVQHLRMRRIEDPGDPTPPPTCGGPEVEARFQKMLKYYGLQEWIYRDSLPEPMEHQMEIGGQVYAVLPGQSPDEAIAFGDMSCQVVSVPRGWEVMMTDAGDFEDAIRELANHSWGALRLCAMNPGGGFSSYLTRLHGGGAAGTRWSGDARMLSEVLGTDGRQFRFSSACSARLVVRRPAQPSGLMPDGGEPGSPLGAPAAQAGAGAAEAEGRRITAI